MMDFPRGGHQPLREVRTYYLTNFSRKLHENEEGLAQRGGRVSLAPPTSTNKYNGCSECQLPWRRTYQVAQYM